MQNYSLIWVQRWYNLSKSLTPFFERTDLHIFLGGKKHDYTAYSNTLQKGTATSTTMCEHYENNTILQFIIKISLLREK